MKFTIEFLALALIASPLAAQRPAGLGHDLSLAYGQCLDAAEGVAQEMSACAHQELQRQDARLNQAYRMLMARLPAARQAQLRQSERNWIQSRDRICRKDLAAGGGMNAIEGREMWGACLAHETSKRVTWLEQYR